MQVVSYAFILLVAISAVVLVHEFGHFLFARLCGIRVERFSIGLGPELAGVYDRYGTRFSVSAIPIAGFVKFHGPARVETSKTDMINYDQSPIRSRLIIVLAGPLFSILLSILAGAVDIHWYAEEHEPVVGGVTAGGPAQRAGIEIGDRILSINGIQVRTFFDVMEAVQVTQKDVLTLRIQRGWPVTSVSLTPETQIFEADSGCSKHRRVLGIEASKEPYLPSLFEAVQSSSFETAIFAYQTLYAAIPDQFQKCSSLAYRMMVSVRSHNYLLSLTKALSNGYAIASLLPLPFLDGAELLFCIAILIRGRALQHRTQDRISALASAGVVIFGFARQLIATLL